MDNISLIENISAIYKKISHAAMRAGRNPEDIRIVAVTKAVNVNRIREAVDAGLRVFGESRIQEAKEKISNLKIQISNSKIEWHLIGHLQSNKAKTAVELFDLIHSVDSFELAETLNKHAEKIEKKQSVLIQVKLSDEQDKHGILKDNLISMFGQISKFKNLDVKGLMTIPPYFENPEKARPYFRELKRLRDAAIVRGGVTPPLHELSMGMTNDFEIAVEEGATIVRIGTAIFGERKFQEAK